jgi:hypothetical protein
VPHPANRPPYLGVRGRTLPHLGRRRRRSRATGRVIRSGSRSGIPIPASWPSSGTPRPESNRETHGWRCPTGPASGPLHSRPPRQRLPSSLVIEGDSARPWGCSPDVVRRVTSDER